MARTLSRSRGFAGDEHAVVATPSGGGKVGVGKPGVPDGRILFPGSPRDEPVRPWMSDLQHPAGPVHRLGLAREDRRRFSPYMAWSALDSQVSACSPSIRRAVPMLAPAWG